MAINQLKVDAQSKFLTVAFGLHRAKGHLTVSDSDGTYIYGYNALGEGQWNRCKGAWYKGVEIAPADYNFHTGALATGMTTGPQLVDSFFPLDVPHTRTAAMGWRIPLSLGDADTQTNPPLDFESICETKLCADYNASGVQTGFSYSANPGRAIVELLKTYCRMPNLPADYASAAAYWLSRIDWGAWIDYRNYTAGTETVDYRTIPDFEGFGLTASYYTGTTFNTFVAKFVHSNFDISYALQPPTAGINGDFSARFEGYIFFPFTETFTIYITHNDGARLWLNSVQKINAWNDSGVGPVGTDSGTFNAATNQSVDILMHWNDKGGGNYKVEWESASQPRQVIPSKYLYPKAEAQAREETHVFFDTPTYPIDAINAILLNSNSIMQDVNGKLRFVHLDMLEPSFTFDSSSILENSFKFTRRDILRSNPITEYRGQYRDLDSQYLEEPAIPVSFKPDWLVRKELENIKTVNLANNTRFRILKILQTRARLEVGKDLLAEFESLEANGSYTVIAGDVVTINHRKIGAAKNYLVRESSDRAANISRDGKESAARRFFKCQEW